MACDAKMQFLFVELRIYGYSTMWLQKLSKYKNWATIVAELVDEDNRRNDSGIRCHKNLMDCWQLEQCAYEK